MDESVQIRSGSRTIVPDRRGPFGYQYPVSQEPAADKSADRSRHVERRANGQDGEEGPGPRAARPGSRCTSDRPELRPQAPSSRRLRSAAKAQDPGPAQLQNGGSPAGSVQKKKSAKNQNLAIGGQVPAMVACAWRKRGIVWGEAPRSSFQPVQPGGRWPRGSSSGIGKDGIVTPRLDTARSSAESQWTEGVPVSMSRHAGAQAEAGCPTK